MTRERRRKKTIENLIEDLKWQGTIGIYQHEVIIEQLQKLNRKVGRMATAEQVAALKTAIDDVEATLTDEINEVLAKLEEASGGGADPALDAEIARLTALKDKIEGIIAAAPTPPSE